MNRLDWLPEQYGIVTAIFESDPSSPSDHARKLDELGAGSIRLDLYWREVQPTSGTAFNWTAFDGRVQRARERKIKMFVTIQGTPAWANGGADGRHPPSNFNDWYVFVRATIDRFGGQGDITFGIWNEPDLSQFLDPNTPEVYAELFRYANAARLASNSSVSLGAPETTVGALTSGWFDQAMSAIDPLLRAQDVITVHYYGGVPLVLYMDTVIARSGGRETWLTESGYDGSDEPGQANWLRGLIDTFNLRYGASAWKRVFPYVLHNDGTSDEAFVRPNWSNKPVFDAYRRRIARRVPLAAFQARNGQFVDVPPVANPAPTVRANANGIVWFRLMDLNAGAIVTGDWVLVGIDDGRFLRSDNAGQMKGDRDLPSDWFRMHGVDPGPIVDGSRVALQYFRTNRFATAVGGGGGIVTVQAPTVGPDETFLLRLK